MSSTTFLNLPREVRNIVYSYLSHDIAIDWGYKMFSFPIGGHAAVKLQITNAPFPEVLLVCSQVYHEYRQEKRHGRPCLTIDVSPGRTWRMLEGQPTNQGRVFKILSRVSHLSFHYTSTSYHEVTLAWETIEQLSGAMAVLAPDLRTIRVAKIPLQGHILSYDAERLSSRQDAIPFRLLPNELHYIGLATSLVTYGQLAFWNDRLDLVNSTTTGCQLLAYKDGEEVGEWHYTRRKNDAYLEALQQMYSLLGQDRRQLDS
jgi:hypothetical protein